MAIDEAFVLCESILDATGQPLDYRLIEVNPAFATMTGISPAEARDHTVRAPLPEMEEWWVESCRRVALSGAAERIEQQIAAQERWHTIYLFACGDGQVALLFSDISERKQNEQTLHHFNETLEARVAERTAQLRALAATLTMAEQVEHQRLARVLHNDLQQLLYALRMRASLCIESATDAGIIELAARIQEIYVSLPCLSNSQRGRRDCALVWHQHRCDRATRERSRTAPAQRDLGRAGGRAHGAGARLSLEVDHVRARGTPAHCPNPARRERLRLFDGRMQITTTLGEGTCITLAVPIAQTEQAEQLD